VHRVQRVQLHRGQRQVTQEDYAHEQALRAQTREKGAKDAARILADFYEQHGQPSRAALWRESRIHPLKKLPVDLLVHAEPQRKKAAMWLLGHVLSRAELIAAFRSTKAVVAICRNRINREICEAANRERHHPTMSATQRLQKAGALPQRYDAGIFELGELPPDSWPRTFVDRGTVGTNKRRPQYA